MKAKSDRSCLICNGFEDFSSRGSISSKATKEDKSAHVAFGSKFIAPDVVPSKRKALSAPVQPVS